LKVTLRFCACQAAHRHGRYQQVR